MFFYGRAYDSGGSGDDMVGSFKFVAKSLEGIKFKSKLFD